MDRTFLTSAYKTTSNLASVGKSLSGDVSRVAVDAYHACAGELQREQSP